MTDTLLPSPLQLDSSFLSLLPLFAHVPLELLERVIREDAVHYYHDGDILCHQGDPPEHLFILLHGQARILTDGIFLIARKPYEILGELAFINQMPRNATVVAQGAVQALVLQKNIVEQLMTNGVFTRNLLRHVAEKLHESTQERAFHFRHEALLFREFRAHLSPVIAQRLLATGQHYGTPRFIDAVLLFADIRNFTERSSTMTPEQLVQELNPYLDAVVSVIHRYEGMVDKFIGDAVFALWGIAPSQEDPIQQAFACAKEILLLSAQLSFGGAPLQLGIGLNAGHVFSGNVGSEEKRQFTVLGHPVNLAARYEGATKDLQAPLVMGEAFVYRLPPALQAQFRRHDHVAIRGAGMQTVYSYDPAIGEERSEQ